MYIYICIYIYIHIHTFLFIFFSNMLDHRLLNTVAAYPFIKTRKQHWGNKRLRMRRWQRLIWALHSAEWVTAAGSRMIWEEKQREPGTTFSIMWYTIMEKHMKNVYMYVCVCMCILYIYMNEYEYSYIWLNIWMNHIYLYIYVCIHTHTDTNASLCWIPETNTLLRQGLWLASERLAAHLQAVVAHHAD